jgi:phospholipid/cholesterol/gamma-HCH transport system substrate-binding protein
VDFGDRIYAPVEGTPLPPEATPPLAPGAAPPPLPGAAPPPPVPVGPPATTDSLAPPDVGGEVAPATPSAYTPTGSSPGPSVAIAHYDPQTGRYATPDGKVYQQTDLVDPPKTWQDLIFKAGQ